ncbi:MAG: hypothetical protein VKN33_09325 [Candidatus Sericytochromatia bacterium]|nr:hypothetical protein [Candidatus Sericytochromatia bacterium]
MTRRPPHLPGLPIGLGAIWRRPKTRFAMLAAALSAIPPAIFVLRSAKSISMSMSPDLAPLIALSCLILLLAGWHERYLLRLTGAGMLSGTTAGIFAGMILNARAGGAPTFLTTGGLTGWETQQILIWGLGGGFAGIAYALFAGKAHWGWGIVYSGFISLGLRGLETPPYVLVPHPIDAWTQAFFSLGLGLPLGLLNQCLQPPTLRSSKIIFLRDYAPLRTLWSPHGPLK